MRLEQSLIKVKLLPRVASTSHERLRNLKERLMKILCSNIIPFWYRVVDRESGGYNLNHDLEGNPLGKGTRMIVTQARMLWYFSMLYRKGWAGKEALEAAEHGFSFLCDKMYDREYGGFFWEVDHTGRVLRDFKHLYGQAFALYGISEYALASGSGEARNLAGELFELLDSRAHDNEYGGFLEFFSRDWREPQAPASPVGPRGTKTMNTHLHMMEALSTYFELSKDPRAALRLSELALVVVVTTAEREFGACLDLHDRAWIPIPTGGEYRVSYGHNLEALWLAADVYRQLNIPPRVMLKRFNTIYEYCSRFGFDRERGGVYESGPLGRPADKLEKVWWVQAESLVAMIYMYSLTGEERFLNDFERTLEWIEKHQVDWRNGDWFETVLPDGKASGMKAHIWKGAYHNSRAMVKSMEIIDELLSRKG